MKWRTQDGNITTNLNVNADFTLPALSAKNVVTWKCPGNKSAKGRPEMILGRDILLELGLNLNVSDHIIESDGGSFIGDTAPMVDLVTCVFKDLNTGRIKPEESFTDAYVK